MNPKVQCPFHILNSISNILTPEVTVLQLLYSSFPGGKSAGREADHSPPSSTEDKNDGAVPPLRM
jgi:hypothetical protein